DSAETVRKQDCVPCFVLLHHVVSFDWTVDASEQGQGPDCNICPLEQRLLLERVNSSRHTLRCCHQSLPRFQHIINQQHPDVVRGSILGHILFENVDDRRRIVRNIARTMFPVGLEQRQSTITGQPRKNIGYDNSSSRDSQQNSRLVPALTVDVQQQTAMCDTYQFVIVAPANSMHSASSWKWFWPCQTT